MIVYSITISVNLEIQTEWLEWMMLTHIPEVLKAGYFSNCKFFQVLEPGVTDGKIRFNVQYECESIEKYRTYRDQVAPSLMMKHSEKFGTSFEAIRELLAPLNLPEGKVTF